MQEMQDMQNKARQGKASLKRMYGTAGQGKQGFKQNQKGIIITALIRAFIILLSSYPSPFPFPTPSLTTPQKNETASLTPLKLLSNVT